MKTLLRCSAVLLSLSLALIVSRSNALAQCVELGPFQNHTGAGQVSCACFVPGEQAGAVLNVPANEYPIEILKIGVGWASQFGGSPATIEQALHVYLGGLPNPGVPIFSLLGPQLNDGFVNEFNIEPLPGAVIIPSGPFTVTLEFLNQNAGDPFAGTVVHDGNGCQPGKNVVFAIPGGWSDACPLGVTGDWVFHVKYRSLKAVASAAPSPVAFSGVTGNQTTCDTVYVRNDGCDDLLVDGINGCTTAPFSIDTTMTAHSIPPGDSTAIVVCVTPTNSAADSCTITVVSNAANGDQQIAVTLANTVTGIGAPQLENAMGPLTIVPNPFNPSTTVRFVLPQALPVTADVFDIGGRHVRTLARDRLLGAGANELQWNGLNANGQPVSSGVYLVRVSTRLGIRVSRAVLLK